MSDSDLAGRRVLIVEDETLVAMMIEDMVSDLGGTVIGPAGNLDEALILAEEAEIDVAILDVNLNGQPSQKVADRLVRRGVAFVFATGYGRGRLEKTYENALVLKKPFGHDQLAAALTRALNPGQIVA